MRWSKFMLLIIAIVTLTIGITLLAMLFKMPQETPQENQSFLEKSSSIINDAEKLQDLKDRFRKGSYILTTVALIELIIILRLFK
ncbi:MAG: hypothetical protein WC260_00715 [Candidatus Pacearchaeota archaeon]